MPLRVLRGALESAQRGRGRVVLVSGEPGIGKSALVSRFVTDVAQSARVLVGMCDDLVTPRPLGAFRDLADQLPVPLAKAMSDPHGFGDFCELVVRELRTGPAPTILVVEDVHWADDATTDAITVVARRLPELPVVLVLTLRPGELRQDHPMRSALETMQPSTMLHVELKPLSLAAVTQMAGDSADRVFELSSGNPFFVTELLAHGVDPVPPSLEDAVLGRVARLGTSERHLLELISVAPGPVPMEVLDVAEPRWADAADAAEHRQLLASDGVHVRFRHEVTRAVVLSCVAHGRRRRLHGRLLEALLSVGAEPADLVHHAEAAGATDVVAEYSLDAARQAAATGSNREAFANYRRAGDLTAGRLTTSERASLAEELARSAWLTGQVGDAIRAATIGIDLAGQLGDAALLGRLASLRSRLHWFRGDGEAAWRDACAGIENLSAGVPSPELARAHAQAAELSMLASRTDDVLRFGQKALQLDPQDVETQAAALAAIGVMRLQLDIDDVEPLLRALEVATTSGQHERAVFTLIATTFVHLWWVRPDVGRTHAERSRAYAREHEFDGLAAFVDALSAWLAAREGRFEAAVDLLARQNSRVRTAVEGSLVDLQARIVLAEVAVRRGDQDADARLRQLVEDVDETRELSRIGPVLELQVERALTCGRAPPVERFEEIARIVGPQPLRAGCGAGRVAAWAAVCGLPERFWRNAPVPHAAMIARDWRAAADAFGAVGWAYDRALMLSMLDDGEALGESLDIARSLGARPLQDRVRGRLRALGMRVPRGPMVTTRANPAQLTNRQLEVLRHVREGYDNARIATLLHISPRTVERHVAAVFGKLGVSSRAEAVARSIDLDLL
ncbi:MAG: ATP-binding protein [Actinomycetota bacterium]